MIQNPLELLRVTEAAAIAASKWVGTGDKLQADKAATEAMRDRLNQIEFSGRILIGEGKKDNSYGMFMGERVGKFRGHEEESIFELAVDPIDGTRPTVTSGPEAISVLAIAEDQALFTTDAFYMHKLAYGPAIKEKLNLHINDPLERTIQLVAMATGKKNQDIMVCLLDRPRHQEIISELRRLKVRIKLIQDCDVSGAIATCLPESGIDLLFGAGGAPEAVLAACAMKCLGGGFQAQLADEKGKVADSKIYSIDELVKSHCAFVATGVTDGSLLKGVRYTKLGPVTHSVVMRSQSGTVRWITAYHGEGTEEKATKKEFLRAPGTI